MPKLTPMQWGMILFAAGLLIYFGFFHKKAAAVTAPAKPGAADEKKFGGSGTDVERLPITDEKLVLSQVGG